MTPHTQFDPTHEVQPPIQLLQMLTSYWVSQAIHVAAKLGIADVLKEGPKRVEELAQTVGAHPQTLYRLLRALASVGIFAEATEGQFELTPLAVPLQTDGPGSMHAAALFYGEPWFWHPWSALVHSVQTGEPAFTHVHGVGFYEYCIQHPEAGAAFDAAIATLTAPHAAAVTAAYDFSPYGMIVDVGGGLGALLIAILQAHPQARGILFDTPRVVEEARKRIEALGLTGRIDVRGGDFCVDVPPGGDVYILKSIIMGENDERSVQILRNCRRVLSDQGKLLVVQAVIPPGNEPFYSKLLDLTMMVTADGRERTEPEYRALLESGGFRLSRIIPTQMPFSIIEAEPV